MSDGMGRELAYLSSHATNRYFIPNWGIYGNLSTDIASYPLGVFTASEKGGKIVFAASTLFLQDNEGASPCSAGASTLYLSADDYKASDFYKEQQTEGGDSDAGSEE